MCFRLYYYSLILILVFFHSRVCVCSFVVDPSNLYFTIVFIYLFSFNKYVKINGIIPFYVNTNLIKK